MAAHTDYGQTPPAYENDEERKRHLQHIEAMAAELQRSVQEVENCYEAVLARLLRQARIRDYLPVLVAKQVRNVLRAASAAKIHER